ncbi:MAG TPA: hypothetical protein VNM45_02760 [Bacillus sp. (in: firmicutes)]|nr:hypothetical protein [Bacillus sp. (in: firmicutes)]
MRRQQVVNLIWENVNLRYKTIRIMGKGKKRTSSPLALHDHPAFSPI